MLLMTVGLIFVGHIIVGFMFVRLVTVGLKKEKKKDKNTREKKILKTYNVREKTTLNKIYSYEELIHLSTANRTIFPANI